jgi:hypothetical protein
MSTLWALTVTLDPRPIQDAKVSDVVNDGSKVRVMVAVYSYRPRSRGFSMSRQLTRYTTGI